MHELLPRILFYVFASITVLSAIMVITQNNPVRSVLFLVLAFFTSAVLWILANSEFLALILVLVYVGAVMTLFLFVVMMLNMDAESIKLRLIRYIGPGLLIMTLLTGLLWHNMPTGFFNPLGHASTQLASMQATPALTGTLPNTMALGMVLYTDYMFAFEIAAVILLVAIIAAITLVHRAPLGSKRQVVVRQIMTRREDRVTLVKMAAEPSVSKESR